MRVVHFASSDDRPHAEALCGDWGSMDSDWTDVSKGVTCADCRTVLRAHEPVRGGAPHPEAPIRSDRSLA